MIGYDWIYSLEMELYWVFTKDWSYKESGISSFRPFDEPILDGRRQSIKIYERYGSEHLQFPVGEDELVPIGRPPTGQEVVSGSVKAQ